MEDEDDVLVIQLQVCGGLGKLNETSHDDGTTTTRFERGKDCVESVKDILRYVPINFSVLFAQTSPGCASSSG